MEENPLGGFFILPGGLFQNGACFHEVKLHPLTGKVEELLGCVSDSPVLAPAITTLLVHCIKRIGTLTDITPEIIRSLLVGDRDYLVMKLRQITIGDKVEAILVCPNPKCGEKIDIDFDLKDIPNKQGKMTSPFFTLMLPGQTMNEDNAENGHYQVEFRLPNGGDQEELALLEIHNETEAVNKLLARCIKRMDGIMEINESHIKKLSLSARRKIEKTMSELAPQIGLEMEAKCPECKKNFSFNFNLSQFFLDEMKIKMDQLYQEIHLLAFYYKWSESEILSMTSKKRRKYLELLSDHLGKSKRAYSELSYLE